MLGNAPEVVAPRCPAGRRIYSIGDIHGRADLLDEMHSLIRDDSRDFGGSCVLVYLGDYIDRGERSREVLERLMVDPVGGFEAVFLRGNHEQMLLDVLEDPGIGRLWLEYGGRATLASYGVELAGIGAGDAELDRLRAELSRKLPDDHLDFLRRTRFSHAEGSFYFVHAGIDPRRPLDRQDPEVQLWIREEFTASVRNHGAIVVHGHSISAEPDVRPNRIGIDTGAYLTNRLTCLVLEGEGHRFLQTRALGGRHG
jgi:serine/threonine protein phosphatase 1